MLLSNLNEFSRSNETNRSNWRIWRNWKNWRNWKDTIHCHVRNGCENKFKVFFKLCLTLIRILGITLGAILGVVVVTVLVRRCKNRNKQPERQTAMNISLPTDPMHKPLPHQSLLSDQSHDPTRVPLNLQSRLNYGVEDERDENVHYINANRSKMRPMTVL